MLDALAKRIAATRQVWFARGESGRGRSRGPSAGRRSLRPRFEPLEPRLVLDGLVIGELMADNDATLADEDLEFSDWIELSNPTDETVDLEGWYLTDDADDLGRWELPAVMLPAGEQMLVFASGKDRRGDELHTDFKLGAGGEFLALVRPDGITVEFAYAPTFPPQTADVSYGLSADQSEVGFFLTPTPGEANLSDPIDDPLRHVLITEIMYRPAGEDVRREYLELLNAGSVTIDLTGWRFDNGAAFTFGDVAIEPGAYLVIAADVEVFSATYPEAVDVQVVGPWQGQLSNRGETIELVDAVGRRVDRVRYADQGNWGVRDVGPNDRGHTGWIWTAAHDGGGASLELINPDVANDYGQNWTASTTEGGTPGAENSVASADIAPLILNVAHAPAIPHATDDVIVTARLRDEAGGGLAAMLNWRADGAASFTASEMHDDGQHGDDAANDGLYGAVIVAQPNGTVVEFYVEAADTAHLTRTWPAPVGSSGQQSANALYLVDDEYASTTTFGPGGQPLYYLIMTDAERAELAAIGRGVGGAQNSDAQMNATFVGVDGSGVEVRYNIGVRNRGHGSRRGPPNNYRVNFVHDHPYKDVMRINVNCRNVHSQIVGFVMHRMAGLPSSTATPVQVRVNGNDLLGSPYAAIEVPDGDFADRQFPGDGAGNVYKSLRQGGNHGDLRYEGQDADQYRDTYFKLSNEEQDDWTDLIHLTEVLNNAPEETYFEDVSRVIDVQQWMRFLALQALLSNNETGLYRGYGDDFAMYRGVDDPRFVLLPHDLDSLLGTGGGSTSANIFTYRNVDGLTRLMNHPDFIPLYYGALLETIETFFNSEVLGPLFDQVLGSWASTGRITAMKNFVAARVGRVLSQIPQKFTARTTLPLVDGYRRTNVSAAALTGNAHGADTRSVLVNGTSVTFNGATSQWTSGLEVVPLQTLIPLDAAWSYRDDGVDPGAAWREAEYVEDQAWKSGPAALYVEASELPWPKNTQLTIGSRTFYFRTHFDFTGDPDAILLQLTTLVDDGAVFYLNGQEVWRVGIDDGDVDHNTLASRGVGNAAVEGPYAIPTDALRQGDNVLAVEVHQQTIGSGDVVFGMQLETGGQILNLNPGINRVTAEAFDGPNGTGQLLATEWVDVWYDVGLAAVLAGTLTETVTVLDAADGPWRVTEDVIVPAGHTLVIEPGTTVFFDQGRRITVAGRLVAEGTEFERIRFSRLPGSGAAWSGLFFESAEDNRLAYVDLEYATAGAQSIDLGHARLDIDNATFAGTDETVLRTVDSSLIVRNSVFPETVRPTVSGRGLLAVEPYLLFEGNTFGECSGDRRDVVEFTVGDAAAEPPVVRFLDNVFLGGGDDALDLDGTYAYIEGNTFLNFQKNFDPDDTGLVGESHAITTGDDGAAVSRHVIVRNVFVDCDHAVLVKDRSTVRFENNTVVGAVRAAINFHEPLRNEPVEPGVGAYLDGNVFVDTPVLLANVLVDDPVWGSTEVTVHRSIVPVDALDLGVGNVAEDPRLADPAGRDITLLPGSPALASGPNGIDMGAAVAAGPRISGEPAPKTTHTTATLTVAGPGITHYRARLDAGPFGAAASVETPLQLGGLADGEHTVYVIARNAAGIWQDEADAVASMTWTVNGSAPPIEINEVLAINAQAVEREGAFPDLIELFNGGMVVVDLGGMGLSDDPHRPHKFAFPAETTVGPGEYLVLYADDPPDTADAPGASGLYLGFALDGDGEGVFLFDAPANGGGLVDTVRFGPQVADLSIGRLGQGREFGLTQPTFGSANVAQRTGDPSKLKLNEWFTSGEVLLDEDFLELFNPDTLPVALAGMYLTDDPVVEPGQHEIAPLSFIGAGGYVVFTADGRPGDGPSHLGFRLAAEEEFLALYAADLDPAAEYPIAVDRIVSFPLATDASQGRSPDGGPLLEHFRLPTPGVANVTATSEVVGAVLMNDRWAYNQSGGDLGTAWREVDYPPAETWDVGEGVLAYETGTLPLIIRTPLTLGVTTYYFRTTFDLDAEPRDVSLEMTTLLDDGAIFYLNGQELRRIRMPDGEVAFDGFSQGSVGNATLEGPFALPTDALVRGKNVLAVEVHQTNPTSPDVTFALLLLASVKTEDQPYTAAALDLLEALRVTEVMFHSAEDDDREFIELQNTGQAMLDLGGVRLTGGVEFVFPPLRLSPGQSVVVVRDREAFESHYGSGVNVAGQYSGALDNGGEEIVVQLAAPLDVAAMRFSYDDLWYPETDGGGRSLQVRDLAAHPTAWNDATNWQPSSRLGGTPGGLPSPDVVINEVLTHTDDPLVDAVELHNLTDDPIDVGGWWLSDSAADYQKFRIPEGTEILAGGYLTLYEGHYVEGVLHVDPLVEFGGAGTKDFALSGAHGDDVYLVEADALGVPIRFVDHAAFGAAGNAESFGRWPDGRGPLVPMSELTLGRANTGHRVGAAIISELHYNPAPDDPDGAADLEFVEIFNASDTEVDLGGWQLAGGIEFTFAAGTTLQRNETMVVVPFDPGDFATLDTFLALYGVAVPIRVVGGFSGRLDNGGEKVQLLRPDEPPAGEPSFVPMLIEDEVAYDDGNGWPTVCECAVPGSLHRVAAAGLGSDPAHWDFQEPTPGRTPLQSRAEVVGRYVFYNNSAFDGDDPAPGADDDAAVAPDKIPLLPGQAAGFANYTSFSNGINGIMIDVTAAPANVDAADFRFRVGNHLDTATWTDGPKPVSVTVRPGAGVDASDRITLVWNDHTILGRWLEVTVTAAGLGLPADDVFYFGNAVAEAANTPGNSLVTATDLLLARNNSRNFLDPAAIDFLFDYNRDQRVNATDVLLARNNQTNFLSALKLLDLSNL